MTTYVISKIKVEGFSRMPEGDKKNQVVEQINYLCQELGGGNNVCSQIEVEECCVYRPLNYRVYRLSLDEPEPCQLIQFSIRFKHQIHINKSVIKSIFSFKNNLAFSSVSNAKK
jgi:hypothetical protein